MMGKHENKRKVTQTINIDDLVPYNHIIRKIDKAIDLTFIYDKVSHLYSKNGTKSIDPIVLIKIPMIQYIFGIPSMRQTIREIEVNLAYRWYLGYNITEKIPHFSTFGKVYKRKFENTDIFQDIFNHIISEVIKCGFLEAENIFIDGTHIKACANLNKMKRVEIEKSTRFYEQELMDEINKDREIHGKTPLKKTENVSTLTKTVSVSTTDPECGIFHKGEHKRVMAYSTNTACDRNSYILDFEVCAGNTNDNVSFPGLYNRLIKQYPESKNIVVDAGYKIPAIAKLIIETDKTPIMPYKRPVGNKEFMHKNPFNGYVYDEMYDCYLCPENEILKYSTTNRDGYKEYKSDKTKCEKCPRLNKCTLSKNHTKIVTRHVWEEYMEQVEEIRHTVGSKEIYSLRSQTIERVFADAKEKHGMRYTQYRGLAKVKMELTLLFACMNLKKLANWKHIQGLKGRYILYNLYFFDKFMVIHTNNNLNVNTYTAV